MHFATRLLSNIPLIGWFIKDAMNGSDTSKIMFFLNLVMVWMIAIYFVGYPAIIVPLLVAVLAMFVILLTITAGDFMKKHQQ